jgi:hypothetical protein
VSWPESGGFDTQRNMFSIFKDAADVRDEIEDLTHDSSLSPKPGSKSWSHSITLEGLHFFAYGHKSSPVR